MGRAFHTGSTSGHRREVQGDNRTRTAKEGNTNPGGGCRDPRGHDHRSAPGTGGQTGATLRGTHVPNLHPQGRGRIHMERTGERVETELPCAHDIRLDGRTHRKDNKTQPARHGRNADHNGKVPGHGTWCFIRPETPLRNPVQEPGRSRKGSPAPKGVPGTGANQTRGNRTSRQSP